MNRNRNKICWLIVVIALFTVALTTGCKKEKSSSGAAGKIPKTGAVEDVDIAKISNTPYSGLTPEEQRLKLQNAGIDLLDKSQGLSNLTYVATFNYFQELLDTDFPEQLDNIELVQEGTVKTKATTKKDIFDLKNIYGVYTWDAKSEAWKYAKSTSELKFVFPSEAVQKKPKNNAIISFKVTTNTKLVYEMDDMNINLPVAVSCTLTIDGKSSASIEAGADYPDANSLPTKVAYKMTLDRYVFWYSLDRGASSKVQMQFLQFRDSKKTDLNNPDLYDSLLEGMFTTDAAFDDIFEQYGKPWINDGEEPDDDDFTDDDYKLLGTAANGYIKITDNLMLLFSVNDVANFVKTMKDIDDRYQDDWWSDNDNNDVSSRYDRNARNSEVVKAYSQYVNISLVATEDNYKIATVILKDVNIYTDKVYDINQQKWVYDETGRDEGLTPYLRFDDGVENTFEVYFTDDNFKKLIDRVDDFIDAFDK